MKLWKAAESAEAAQAAQAAPPLDTLRPPAVKPTPSLAGDPDRERRGLDAIA